MSIPLTTSPNQTNGLECDLLLIWETIEKFYEQDIKFQGSDPHKLAKAIAPLSPYFHLKLTNINRNRFITNG